MCYYGNMSNKVLIVNKKVGETPLEAIKQAKINNPELSHEPMTYAGRLDPLACGVLILLVGDECMKKDKYLALPKEYEVDVLFGFATDTYDVMGKVAKNTSPENELSERSSDLRAPLGQTISDSSFSGFVSLIQKILPKFTGRIKQHYPPYSSRTVKGKPLHEWAREGRLDEIEIPTHDVFVEKIEILKESQIIGGELLEKIKNDISKVSGDFRQSEILKIWEDNLGNKVRPKSDSDARSEKEKYKIISLKISCGSGVYVRGIANDIGLRLGIPALALKIVRTKVGEYKIIKN